MMEKTAMIENLRPLTQEQRQATRKSARNAVIRALGSKPAREQFTHTTISRYPLSVTRLISLLCLILLLAAFTPSTIWLHVIGSLAFGQAASSNTDHKHGDCDHHQTGGQQANCDQPWLANQG
jgi:hypothetical protein